MGRTRVVIGASLAVTTVLVARRLRARRAQGRHGGRDVASSPTMGRRIDRTVALARVGSRTGRNYASMALGSAVASPEKKAELRSRFELATAEQVAETLGNMKGAVMKLGQMASYLDQGLPEPVREALAALQADAPPMSFALVEQVVRAELGAHPDEVFARFDREPIAAASIGQVHRAVTHDGIEVAVKVQYPGVDDAIRSDLDNADLLFTAMGMLFPGMDPAPIVTELRDRISEELDYCIEAAHQKRFADYYDGHPYIGVPKVLFEFSTARVLTTELATGARWAEVLAWPQDERNLVAETIYRYVFTGLYRIGAFNGDPHPGNYLFSRDGSVVFLDYGLCKVFAPDEITIFEEWIRAFVIEHDVARFRRAVEDAGVLMKGAKVSDDEVGEYFGHFYELVQRDKVSTITPEYASESVRRFFDLGGPHGEIIRLVTLPASMVIIQRINLGLYALLAELGASANWRRLANEIWPFVDAGPATPMGVEIAEWERARSLSHA